MIISDQEYVVDLEPNHSTFHENFKVFTQDGPQIVPRDEYIGTVRGILFLGICVNICSNLQSHEQEEQF